MFIYGLLTLLCGLLFFAIGLYFFSLPKEFHMTFYISSGIFIFSLIAFFVLKNPLKLHDIIAHPKVLLSAFFIILFSQFIAAFSLYLSFSALHVPVSALNCILMTGLLCIAMIFPITPGNIGILEALLGSYTHIVFNDFTVGFTAMALLRACQWVFTIIFGVFFSIKLIGKSIPSIRTLINVGDKTNIV